LSYVFEYVGLSTIRTHEQTNTDMHRIYTLSVQFVDALESPPCMSTTHVHMINDAFQGSYSD